MTEFSSVRPSRVGIPRCCRFPVPDVDPDEEPLEPLVLVLGEPVSARCAGSVAQCDSGSPYDNVSERVTD